MANQTSNSLESQLASLQQQHAQMAAAAQMAAGSLSTIEYRISQSPILRAASAGKISFWTVLFNIKEVIAIITEILTIIGNFRKALTPPSEPATIPGTTIETPPGV